jgi:hypothetical protein
VATEWGSVYVPAAFSTADRNVARRSHPQSARSLQAFYLKKREATRNRWTIMH